MTKIALGTWAWGAGAFGGDKVFGSKTDVENLKPVFDTAMKEGLNLWDTATVIEQKNLVQSLLASLSKTAWFVVLLIAPLLSWLQRYLILLRIYPLVSLNKQKRRKTPLFWQVKLLFSLKIHKSRYEAWLFIPYLKLIH